MRLRASEALWEAAKKDLVDPLPFLARNLNDPEPRLRLGAIEMLRRWGKPPAVAPLGRAALDKRQPETVRLRCIAALGAIFYRLLTGRTYLDFDTRDTPLAQSGNSDEIFRCAAGGFRDFTRIASSDPVMWRDIAIANRDALLNAIDLFSDHLGQLRRAVADEDAAGMQETFARAKAARDAFSPILDEQGRGKKT